MDRRTFLKITGLGSVAFAGGCTSDPENNLFSLVKAPDDMVTGRETWYATTCRECPAGCGVLAKNREGRVIKLEGNPLHPVNQGKLCVRGQAALQGLYNPDRITNPLLKTDKGWQEINFTQAQDLIRQRFLKASEKGPHRVAMLTEVVGDTLLSLFNETLAHYNAKPPVIFEPFAHESLKFAHQRLFGDAILPGYHMEKADLLVSFGADFLETWLSPVEYARKFSAMHRYNEGRKNAFIHISPFQSLTAANADTWLACRPGREAMVVMGLIKQALHHGRGSKLPEPILNSLRRLTSQYTFGHVANLSGIAESDLEKLSNKINTAKRPLVLGGPVAGGDTSAVGLDLATLMLNAVLDPDYTLYDFTHRHRVEKAHTRREVTRFFQQLDDAPIDLLLLNNVNPLFTLPPEAGASKALAAKLPYVVVFSNFMDETAASADLIFPTQLPLEMWDVYESHSGFTGTLQPCAGETSKAPNIGDLFLSLLPPSQRPYRDYHQYLIGRTIQKKDSTNKTRWLQIVQKGGLFYSHVPPRPPNTPTYQDGVAALGVVMTQAEVGPSVKKPLYLLPSIRHFDGRGANRSWLSEIPDTISQVAWQNTAWVHPETMKTQGWEDGELIHMTSAHGEIEVPVQSYKGLHPTAMAMTMGLGHTQYGRFAKGLGANPVVLMSPDVDENSGAPIYRIEILKTKSLGRMESLAKTSGSNSQYGRKIALSVPLGKTYQRTEKQHGLTMKDFPLTLPLPEGYDAHRDIYPPHDHDTYRWGMIIDLDRCIGCSACVAACYAENNIGVVGRKQMTRGREMAWLRIERYEDADRPEHPIFLPMMCQHCDNAPCEAVCPVYAPHHSKEGLNNQVYNRCIGTRFCAQNCPYKVRRFNWFDWPFPEPLPMQLNPDVTVRSKGVMEKCSFCVQRIKAAHGEAKDQQRTIGEGEVVPACVQTCPADALHFGNLMNTNSLVRILTNDPRAYQVMGYLNTKPAVIYLKKVTQTL